MSFWTEIHWSEGMFLRPHHLQLAQRWMETVVDSGLDAARPFAWGFLNLQIAPEPLENATLRLDSCTVRLKDGTWVQIPENTQIAPLNF
ncbi:MAG: type VI secretion system baseplate subunit TssK, partial [Phycisphaerae bacterium]